LHRFKFSPENRFVKIEDYSRVLVPRSLLLPEVVPGA